jgi:hypothetical protein
MSPRLKLVSPEPEKRTVAKGVPAGRPPNRALRTREQLSGMGSARSGSSSRPGGPADCPWPPDETLDLRRRKMGAGPARPRDLKRTYQTLLRSSATTSMASSSPSSGESTPSPSPAEPPFCGGRSRHSRSQSINDGSDPVLSSWASAPVPKGRYRAISLTEA